MSPSRGHSAHVGQEVEVHYRWHPYFGRRLRCENSEERANGRIIHLVVAPGHVITAPAWMIDPVACAAMDLGSPRVSLAALLELHKLLIERRFRRGSPDGFTIAEAQHENPATPDTISRSRSPTQLAARLAEAERAEFSATDHSDRPARQRTDGRRRRGNGGGELR
ncbi:hypothetical protein NKH55_27060 [Mesorhizobium opportunistum]|uniref:hypothetical protein n=1 Tax=Mesorhizobium opportunistum TaxID=593909 RepID=UPI00333C086B